MWLNSNRLSLTRSRFSFLELDSTVFLVLFVMVWGTPGLYCSFSGSFTSNGFLITLVLWVLLVLKDLFSDLAFAKSADWQLSFKFFNFAGECGLSSSKLRMSSKKHKSGLIVFFFELVCLSATGFWLRKLVFFRDFVGSVARISWK